MNKHALRQRRRIYTKQFYCKNHGAFVLSVVQSLIMIFCNLLISWLMQALIDVCTGEDGQFTLLQLIVLFVLCLILLCFSLGLAYLSKPRFFAKAIGQYKEFVFEKLSQKGISAFYEENTSFYISALSNDASTIETNYLGNLFSLVEAIGSFIGAFALMLYYSPLLTAIAIALSLLPIVASVLVGNRVADAEKQVSEKNAAYLSTLKDSLSGFSVIKSFQAEAAMCQLFRQRIQAVTHAKTRRQKAAIIVQCMSIVSGLIAQFGVFIAGAALTIHGHAISAGTLIVFLNLMNSVVNPINTVPQSLAECKAAYALIDKVAAALEENIREDGGVAKTALEHGIAIKDLTFGYEPDNPVLHHVNFTFEAGKSYAIVGASGSGKSTLLNLLMASHSGYHGTISYDDTPLPQISSESLYELVSVVQQNVFIFDASIRDNITMFSDFPASAVDRAIALSGLSALIDTRGENYLCGENGSGLSGGEKQRISIARSLLKRSQILLVDEATAALDAQTAFQVSDAILNLDGLTRIVVTHALDATLLRRYDCILTLKNGCIAEYGSFDALMAHKDYFYSLFTFSQ